MTFNIEQTESESKFRVRTWRGDHETKLECYDRHINEIVMKIIYGWLVIVGCKMERIESIELRYNKSFLQYIGDHYYVTDFTWWAKIKPTSI